MNKFFVICFFLSVGRRQNPTELHGGGGVSVDRAFEHQQTELQRFGIS